MNLEDHLGDIIRKARAMTKVSSQAAAAATRLSEQELKQLEDTGTASTLVHYEQLAKLIGLDGRRLRKIFYS